MACSEYHCNNCGNIQRTPGVCCGQAMTNYHDEESKEEHRDRVQEMNDRKSYKHYKSKW